MTQQEIDDQLELLRLKELFMSDIKIRSKMAVLICNNREEDPPFKEFCELTHCTPDIAKMFAQLLVIDVFRTPEEIAAERERLERMKSGGRLQPFAVPADIYTPERSPDGTREAASA